MRSTVALAVLALVLAAPVAFGADQFEPNDSRDQATPLQPGQSFDASRDAPSDVDYYVFYARGGQSVDVAITNQVVGSSCQDFIAVLQDDKGKELDSARPGTQDTGTVKFRRSKAS